MNNFKELNSKDVVALNNFDAFRVNAITQQMLKVEQFQEQAIKYIIGNSIDQRVEKWQKEGVRCEVLQPGGDWQRGKVRMKITLEFCPDEPKQPPSPLDDIRKQMKETEN
ncbi:KGK domain-containing protein [Floridanema evergladense]|uniref:KGK domain-containing protein n=1 Tax=Floridaenema evergladense BLCC-F167 TaxID=3153639 RepID=A0ABV4WUK1_9CYAN